MRNLLIASAIAFAAAAPLASAPSSAEAVQARSPNGTWRCNAAGNIPIGLMTITGSRYRFQAVRNGNWDPKPQDPMNGSGAFQAQGTQLNPTSGPLRTELGSARGVFGETSSPYSGRYDYIQFYNGVTNDYVLLCHRR